MSSLPYAELTDLFNPNDFTALDSSLSLATADQRYVRIGSAGYLSSLTAIGNVDAASFSLSGASIDLSAITGITNGICSASKALIVDTNRDITNIRNLTTTGTVDAASLSIASVPVDLTLISGITPGICSASKALIVDTNRDITNIRNLTATGSLNANLTASGLSWNSIAGTSTIALNHTLNGTALLGSTTNTAFGFLTNNTERARILNNGNFGIGTASAAYKLDVSGDINTSTLLRVNRSTSGQAFLSTNGSSILELYHTRNSDATFGTTTAHSLIFETNAAARMTIAATGEISGISSITGTTCDFTTFKQGGVTISFADLPYLSGLTPGIATANKALVCGASKSIISLDVLGCSDVLFDSATSKIQWGSSAIAFQIRQPSSTFLQVDTGSTSTTGSYLRILSGNNASYVDWTLKISDYTNASSCGFYRVATNTLSTGREWIRNDAGALGFSTRSGFTGASSQADIFIHNNNGTVSFGKTNLISANHRLEVNGSINVSNTASAVALSNSPIIGVFDSTQSGLQGWQYWGRDLSNKSSWTLGSDYTGSSSDNNYMYIKPVNTTVYGFVMNHRGNVSINGRNAGGTAVLPIAPLSVVGYESVSVPAGYGYLSTGPAAVAGGSVNVSLTTTNDIWCAGNYYSTSDARFKKNISPIPEEEALKLLKINPIFYEQKIYPNGQEVGVIAQQLLEVELAHFVKMVKSSNEELASDIQYTVNYDRLTVYLIKLCQMQQKQIDSLARALGQAEDTLPVPAKRPYIRKLKRVNF